MKVYAFLGDSASIHPDGTFSVLRAGIDRVTGKNKPIVLRGAFIARIISELSELGSHSFEILVINKDGKEVAPRLAGQFQVPEGGNVTNLILSFSIPFPDYGEYYFALKVDNKEEERILVKVADKI